MTFSKLDEGITKSSVWSEALHVRVVWIAFLAEKDENGFVAAARSGMIRVCNVTPEQFDDAERILSSPDPESRTKDFEGRRIEKIEGGWVVLNHEKYRLSEQVKKEKHKEYMQNWRKSKDCEITVNTCEFTNVHNVSPSVSVSVSESASVSEEGRDSKEKETRPEKIKHLDYVFLTQEQHDKLLSRLGQKYLDRCIEVLDAYITNNAKGKKYKDHYKCMIQWVIARVAEEGYKEQPCNIEEIRAAAANKTNIDKACAEAALDAEARKKQLQEEDSSGIINLDLFTQNIGRKVE